MYFRAVELFVICVDRRDGGAAQREAPAPGVECCSERAHASFWRFRLRDAQWQALGGCVALSCAALGRGVVVSYMYFALPGFFK